jgi:hypothetical protein
LADTSDQVIILGSQRSGTTELFNLFTKALGYSGDVESHLWPAVGAAWRELDSAAVRMGGPISPAYKAFTLGKIGPDIVKAKLAEVVVDIYRERFGRRWVDKTPGPEMVNAVPALAATFPSAKFIFLRRRGIENVLSQTRRFPKRPFRLACQEWSESMRAWSVHRDIVQGRYLEIDQMNMALYPIAVAHDIASLLNLSIAEETSISSYLEETRAEQTRTIDSSRTLSLEDTRWSPAQCQMFIERCAPMMATYGYSLESTPHAPITVPPKIPLTFVRSANAQIQSRTGKTHFSSEGITLACAVGEGPETVTLRNVAVSGQNLFESVIRCGSDLGAAQLTLRVTLRRRDAEPAQTLFGIKKGQHQQIEWQTDMHHGLVEIEFAATPAESGPAIQTFTLVKPRLIFRDRENIAVGQS